MALEGTSDRVRAPARTRVGAPELALLVLLCGIWIWWGLNDGAYDEVVFYPGIALLGVAALVVLGAAPWRASLALSAPARLAIRGLIGVALWSVLSALWSPTPDIAIEDGQRMLMYVIAFGLGIWSCVLLGRSMELAMLPLVVAGAVVGLVTVFTLANSTDPTAVLDEDGTIQFPLGYRNATSAFFLIAIWPSLALASSSHRHPVLRIGAFGTATLCAEIAILCQSRGAILGAVAGTVVFVALARHRLHAATWLVLAVAPALICVSAANDLFSAATSDRSISDATTEMNGAGATALAGLSIGLVLGAGAVALARLASVPSWATRTRIRQIEFGALAAIILAVIAIIGNPFAWAGDRADEFCQGEPSFAGETNRFTFTTSSNRCEVWGVSLDAAGGDPVFGLGGGGFQFTFTRERTDPDQLARDAHSVWLEMLSELGAVGLLLFATAMGGIGWAVVRARRLGPAAAQLACGGGAAGAYWLAQSSVDWFWPYPGVTAPALALLGAAIAPALIAPDRLQPVRGRRYPAIAIAVLVVSVIPPFVAASLEDHALETYRSDTEGAYSGLSLARTLDPLNDSYWRSEGAIATELGDDERATRSFAEAVRMRPEEYGNHFFLASVLARTDPVRARIEIAVVRELNPLVDRPGEEDGLDQIIKQIEATENRIGKRQEDR